MKHHVVLIEDVFRARLEIENELSGLDIALTQLKTEEDAATFFSQVPPPQVDLVILDLMLRWSSGESTSEVPDRVLKEGDLEAGFRLLEVIRKLFPNLPVIIHSARDKSFIRERLSNLNASGVSIVPKRSLGESGLAAEVKRLLANTSGTDQ